MIINNQQDWIAVGKNASDTAQFELLRRCTYTEIRYVLFPPIMKSQFDPNSQDFIPLYHDDIVRHEREGAYEVAGL